MTTLHPAEVANAEGGIGGADALIAHAIWRRSQTSSSVPAAACQVSPRPAWKRAAYCPLLAVDHQFVHQRTARFTAPAVRGRLWLRWSFSTVRCCGPRTRRSPAVRSLKSASASTTWSRRYRTCIRIVSAAASGDPFAKTSARSPCQRGGRSCIAMDTDNSQFESRTRLRSIADTNSPHPVACAMKRWKS